MQVKRVAYIQEQAQPFHLQVSKVDSPTLEFGHVHSYNQDASR